MIRHVFRFLSLATMLASITTSYSLLAAETAAAGVPATGTPAAGVPATGTPAAAAPAAETPSANPPGMHTKTKGDDGSVSMPQNGVTQKYGIVDGREGGNKKTVPIAGNTNDKSDKGGYWVQRTHGGKWNWSVMAGAQRGADGKWEGGLYGGTGAEYGGAFGGGAQTPKWGNQKWNIQGRIAGELYAEVKAGLEAGIKGSGDFIGAVAEAEIGAAAGARGKLEGTVTLFGVPVTVRGEGNAMYGAKAKAGGRIGLLKDESGKWKFVVKGGAGVAWGLGLEGNVALEIDAEALCHVLGLDELWKEFMESLKNKDKGNGDGKVTGDDLEGLGTGSSDGKSPGGNKSGYKGIKGLKAHRWGGK